MPLILLIATLVIIVLYARGDVAEFLRFVKLDRSSDRRRRYAIWVVKQVLVFALPTVIGLALIGRLGAFGTMPAEFLPAAALFGNARLSSDFLAMMGGAIAGGLVLGGAIGWWIARRGKTMPTAGNISALLPRNRAELPYGALLSLSAGVTEEAMFRLFLPLLIVLVSGSWLAAFVIPILIFGAMHRYQGWVGVVATTLVGALFTAVYLYSGSILLAMAVHVVIDINGLVVRPVLSGVLRSPND